MLESLPMPSFDIVSEVDLSEVDNALQNLTREIAVRYDFKGSQSSCEHKDGVITIFADDELKLKQMQEILRGQYAQARYRAGPTRFSNFGKSGGYVRAAKSIAKARD